MALRNLTGPRLPAARGAATHLVVLCHGYGADGNDLIGLAPHWQRLMPTVSFVAPNAPEPCAAGPGYQWFPISRLDPAAMRQGVEQAGATLDAFLDAELARANLPEERLALVGFSQGTMMSLHVGLRRAAAPAAIVGYSGLLVEPPDGNLEAFAAEIKVRPPVLLVHGDRDELIPPQALFAAGEGLAALGLNAQWHLSAGVGHGIDAEGLRHGGEFLARAFRVKH
jgi:phospholipase/carboxylesterase